MSDQQPSPSPARLFKGAMLERAKREILKYPKGRQQSAVLALLDLAQRHSQTHHVSPQALNEISALLDIPHMRLVEITSFYSMISLEPKGKFHVQCCTTTPCMLRGAEQVLKRAQRTLGIECGETTADLTFSLSEVECLGACANAPVVQINDAYYEDLTPERTEEILTTLAQGHKVEEGSQIGRHGAAPLAVPKADESRA